MNIKAGNFVVLTGDIEVANQEPFYAIKASGKWAFLRDFLQPHEIGTALIEVERLREGFDPNEHVGYKMDAVLKLWSGTPLEEKLQVLIDAGAAIAAYIDELIAEHK